MPSYGICRNCKGKKQIRKDSLCNSCTRRREIVDGKETFRPPQAIQWYELDLQPDKPRPRKPDGSMKVSDNGYSAEYGFRSDKGKEHATCQSRFPPPIQFPIPLTRIRTLRTAESPRQE